MVEVCLIVKPGFTRMDIIHDVMDTFGIGFLINENSVWSILTKEQAEFHYEEHKDKPFFNTLVEYLISDNCVAIRAEVESVEIARELTTKIREKYSTSRMHNVLHCSDSVEAAKREIGNIFI